MTEQTIDSRQCKRIFFTEADNIEGAVVVEGMANQAIPIMFLNMSEGGISFQAERSMRQMISWDQVITLKVERTGLLAFLDNIEVEVKYVLDYDIVPQVTFGCQFVKLPKIVLNEIKKIIAAKCEQ
jgi:hypothetical protein